MNSLISSVEQEDESNNSMGSRLASSVGVHSRADGLHDEEHEHTSGGGEEEDTTTDLVDESGRTESPSQVPDLEDTVDEELDGLVEDTDGLEDTTEVVRHETVTGPLREEGEGDDDAHTLAVSNSGEESGPADLLSDSAVELDGSLDFIVLVLDEWILLVTITVVVCEGLQSLSIATLVDQPTRRLGSEPDESDLNDGRETLKSGGCAPGPGVLDLEGSVGRPGSTGIVVKTMPPSEVNATHIIAPEYQREL